MEEIKSGPPVQPLTMDELLQMDEKPVWVEVARNELLRTWAVVQADKACNIIILRTCKRLPNSVHVWSGYFDRPSSDQYKIYRSRPEAEK